MSNLEKPLSALTPHDRAALRKYLGKLGRPYPVYEDDIGFDAQGNVTVTSQLKQHINFTIASDRPDEEVFGMAIREMPTPGMSQLFFDAVCLRDPDNRRRLQYLKGFAGAGKTYMSEMIARLRSPKGAIKVDCGGKNLNELLYEMVLDFNSGRSLYAEIDKRIANGNINPLSLFKLKAALGEAYTEEKNSVRIDWSKVGQNLRDSGGDNAQKPQEERPYIESEKAVTIAMNAIRDVAAAEGITIGANALGMATQEGPLIRAWKEGREIILDEFNRGKPGSTSKLHVVLQLINGELDMAMAENTLKEKGGGDHAFMFRREDIKPGFFVTMTGNAEDDGADVEELAQALSSRIIPQHIPHATVEDWQHRLCQILTGLPISTLYYFDKERADANPEGFKRKLLQWRTAGMTERQIKNIPDMQMRWIERWQDIVAETKKVGEFMHGWGQIIDPDAKITRSGNLAQVLNEISDTYRREQSIDFRKITAYVEAAMHQRPQALSEAEAGGIDHGPALDPHPDAPVPEAEDIGLNVGTRFVNTILAEVLKTTKKIGKENTFREVIDHAIKCKLIVAPLNEGKSSDVRSVAEGLNDNPFNSPSPDIRARLVRDMFCAWLRAGDQRITAANDSIMTVPMMRRALNVESERDDVDGVMMFNPNLASAGKSPLVHAPVEDSATAKSAADVPSLTPEQLVSRSLFLYALVAPEMHRANLETLWAQCLSAHCQAVSGLPESEALAMADGKDSSAIRITSLMLSDAGRDGKNIATPLHIIWNKATDRALVVSRGGVAPDLRKAFAAARISYVDANDKAAETKINVGLGQVVGPALREKLPSLKAAFQMRAKLPSQKDNERATVAELLTRADAQVFLPVYIVKPAA